MNWRTLGLLALACGSAVGCQGICDCKVFTPHRSTSATPIPPKETPAAAPVARSQKPEEPARTTGVLPQKPVEPAKSVGVLPVIEQASLKLERAITEARIAATVNGQPILEDEVWQAALPHQFRLQGKVKSQAEFDAAQKQEYDRQLQELINRELLLQDAFARFNKGGQKFIDKLKESAAKEFENELRKRRLELGIRTEEEFKKLLNSSRGASLAAQRRQYERTYLAKQYMQFLVGPALDNIGHRQIVEYFESHPEEFQVVDAVDWLDVFLDVTRYPSREQAKQFAEQLAARAKKGEDFKNFAEFDAGEAKTRGGKGVGSRRGEIRPAQLEATLFQMKDGDVGPVVEMPGGFHVFKLVKRDQAGPMPFDEKVQAAIRDKLRGEAGTRQIQRTLADLQSKAQIEKGAGPTSQP